jgi:hypothetical protein
MCCGFDIEQAMPHARKNFMPFGVGDVWAQRLLNASDFDHSAVAGGMASANSSTQDARRTTTSTQQERQVMTWIKVGEDVYDVFRLHDKMSRYIAINADLKSARQDLNKGMPALHDMHLYARLARHASVCAPCTTCICMPALPDVYLCQFPSMVWCYGRSVFVRSL